jgi:Protein of unknown function with HXXEE motif
MFDSLNGLVRLSTLVWCFPMAFLIHDAEEILAMPWWTRVNQARLARLAASNRIYRLAARVLDISRARFVVGVAFVFTLVAAATLVSIRALGEGRHLDLFTMAVLTLLVNAFTHIGSSLILRSYTPGVATAVLVLLPYCKYTLHRLSVSGQAGSTAGGPVIAIAAAAMCVVVVAAHLFARRLVR